MKHYQSKCWELGLAIVLLVIVHDATCLKVRFFDSLESEVFQNDSDSTPSAGCTTLPDWMATKGYSVKTDGCIILYSGRDCTLFSTKLETTQQDPTNVYYLLENKTALSFHPCTESEGGDRVSVDFYSEASSDDKYPGEGKLTARLNDLCSCTKIPSDVKSLNNHGNCIELYEDEKCSKSKRTIPAGRSGLSNNLELHGVGTVKSVNVCQEPKHCLKMRATITKFEIAQTDNRLLRSLSRTMDVQMAANGTFINNGNATVTQEYVAKKSVKETTMVKRLQSLSQMQTVNVSANVQFDSNFGLFYIDQTKLFANLAAGYNFSSTALQENSETHTVTELKVLQATQKIEIPPCTGYEISSYIKFTEKHPLQYKVYAEVSATLGDKRLLVNEIEKRLTDMSWVSKTDEYTLLAMGKANVFVDFGMESFINGQSVQLNECGRSGRSQTQN